MASMFTVIYPVSVTCLYQKCFDNHTRKYVYSGAFCSLISASAPKIQRLSHQIVGQLWEIKRKSVVLFPV